MPGNAGFGSGDELGIGDYLAQITNVELGERQNFKDQTKKDPAFVWHCDVQVDGEWEARKIYTSRTFTDMSRPNLTAQFVSGLNKLVRACGMPVPRTYEEAQEWDENDLVGKQFVLRVEPDAETGKLMRKFLALAPQAAPAPAPAPAATPARGRGKSSTSPAQAAPAVAEEDEEDIFADA